MKRALAVCAITVAAGWTTGTADADDVQSPFNTTNVANEWEYHRRAASTERPTTALRPIYGYAGRNCPSRAYYTYGICYGEPWRGAR
jgi:hypothetical protein